MRLGFREDTRGVSALVGAVLLLGILVIALASYQAIIVPQQNAQTEFDHNQQVEDEMVDFRNALLEARLDNRERATSVKLGTRYQSRTLAVNPPPATGTLQSTDQGEITVDGTNVELFNLQNNLFFEYTPSYSEYREAGTIRYENTLVYHDFGSANVTLSKQQLIRGDTIRLVPSTPDIDENGINRVTYEPEPAQAKRITVNEPVIELHSKLNASQWRELLEDENEDEGVTVEDIGEDVRFTFDDERKIKYSTVDQDDTPEDPPEPSPGADSPQTEVNPAGDESVILINVDDSDAPGDDVELTFRNRGSTRTVEEVRVPFFIRTSGGGSEGAAAAASTVSVEGVGPVDVGGEFVTINKEFSSGPDNTLSYDFDSYPSNQFFWVTTLLFDNGERATYFIGGGFNPTDPGSGSGSGDDDNGGQNGDDDNGDENGDDNGNGNGDDDQRPSFASISITDTSSSGGSGKARYSLQYTTDTTGTSFDRVEAEFTNTDRDETQTLDDLGTSENTEFESGGQRFGENYDITIRIFDDSGEVESARIELSDTADGSGTVFAQP